MARRPAATFRRQPTLASQHGSPLHRVGSTRPHHPKRLHMTRTGEIITTLVGTDADQELDGTTFSRCTLAGTDARGARLLDVTFEHSELSSVRIDGALLQARFVASKIEGINFFTARRELVSLSFENCLIRYCSLAELKLKELRMVGCTLQHVDLSDADLTRADLTGSTFEDCTFRNTTLTKADLRTARGYSIDPRINKVTGARFDLPEVLGLLDAFDIRVGWSENEE